MLGMTSTSMILAKTKKGGRPSALEVFFFFFFPFEMKEVD